MSVEYILKSIILTSGLYSGISLASTLSTETDASTDSAINQLVDPTFCPGIENISNKPYGIFACFSATLGNNRTNQSLIRDAYRQFHALNWQNTLKVGLADYQQGYQDTLDTFPVWQSWPTIQQVMTNEMTDWQEPNFNVPKSCNYLFESNDTSSSHYERFVKQHPSVPTGIKLEVLTNKLNPQNDVVVDTAGNAVRYQVYLNKPAFDYLQTKPIDGFHYPVGVEANYQGNQQAASSRGAVFIKAAWKQLDDTEKAFYHKSFAVITNTKSGIEECQLSVVGLSSLHIVSKNNPMNDAKPDANKWSWATYQFIGNVPTYSLASGKETLTQSDINSPNALGGRWAYFDKSFEDLESLCLNSESQWDQSLATCPVNKNACEPDSECAPSTIVAYAPVPDVAVLELYNDQTKALMPESVWRNYDIINSQWLDNGYAAPVKLENPILEPFTSKRTSCSGCHARANKTEFKDYIFNSGIQKGYQGMSINLSTSLLRNK